MKIEQFDVKLDAFMELLQLELNSDTQQRHSVLDTTSKQNGLGGYHRVGFDEGPRFCKVWDESGTSANGQKSVKYFVEKSTGIIFGSKGWATYNPIHEYGTLDTIAEWYWGEYYARNKAGKSSLVPKSQRK